MKIEITVLSSGYYHARGDGPCNWAQWPIHDRLEDHHFFPEAGQRFRRALMRSYYGTNWSDKKEGAR